MAWRHSIPAAMIPLGLSLAASLSSAAVTDSAQLKAQFDNPSREYSSAPLWVWNDMMTDKEVIGTLRDLAAQNVKQAIVHPRPGLMTPYLSPEWFRLWKVALNEAEKLDMNLWIYDENSYPSGFAGGFVPEEMPESRGRGLNVKDSKDAPKWSDDVVAVFAVSGDGADAKSANVTSQVRKGDEMPQGRYLTYTLVRTGNSPWNGGRCYVDLTYPGVTEKFLQVTMDAYAREIGDQFGKRVPGVFTDEPHLRPAGSFHWTDNLPAEFEQRWGYKLTDSLPSLSHQIGDWKRVRHDYYQVLSEQFIEHWGKPYYDWCAKHKMEFTGHYWEHSWPHCESVPDNMAMYAWHQRPAIDTLMNQYSEAPGAQFGNVRAVVELASVANQLGRERTLCEIYGAGGWDLRFEDMKRIADWMCALGVNTLDQHLSYVTFRGARKHDHPQSFGYQEPWWQDYGHVGKYLERMSLAVASGEQINHILVIEPTTTAWMYNGDGKTAGKLNELGEAFQKLVTDLAKAQVEFDIGCEDIMARHGKVDGKNLVVGKRQYSTVVIAPATETLNAKSADLLTEFAKAGGAILCCGQPPAMVDGQASPRITQLASESGWSEITADKAPAALRKSVRGSVRIDRAKGDKGLLYHMRRHVADGQVLFLVNTSLDAPTAGKIVAAKATAVQQWSLESGKISAYPSTKKGPSVTATFELAPGGSLLLFLPATDVPSKGDAPKMEQKPVTVQVPASGDIQVRRIEPNVLTIDYVDLTAGGETQKGIYIQKACDLAFSKNGMANNPWHRAVQFKDELISKKFPPESGFEATYHFTIVDSVPAGLAIVIERPDLYAITCNGKPVAVKDGAWWMDRCFGKIDLADTAKVGDNAVTLAAKPMTIWHELDCAYVLGDFNLKAAEHGYAIVPPQPIATGDWKDQGLPFYAAGVSYTQGFDVTSPSGSYGVALGKWLGSVARVQVNGKPAGIIWSQPWALDVTSLIKPGANEIEVTVVGTLKNTLGPHHGNPPLGTAWPAMWEHGPDQQPEGGKYSTVGYGLSEPFKLTRSE
jgi:hypothetical protein